MRAAARDVPLCGKKVASTRSWTLNKPRLDQSQNTRFPDHTTDRFLPADHSFEAFMKRISSAEFVRSFSHQADAALTDPVVITHHGRDRLVMLSVDTYRDLALAVAGDIGAGEVVRKGLEDLERSRRPSMRNAA
jgi:PHD/YefM family antitoxin component YafN of YafNO toxin-antitoxin module